MREGIEIKEYTGEGYMPVIDFKTWRVAILRYINELELKNIRSMQKHNETDEVFVLLEGKCILFYMEQKKISDHKKTCEQKKISDHKKTSEEKVNIEYTKNTESKIVIENKKVTEIKFDTDYKLVPSNEIVPENKLVLMNNGIYEIKSILMERNKLYNVKRGTWHTHILEKDTTVLIIENSNTNDENSPKISLTKEQISQLERCYYTL